MAATPSDSMFVALEDTTANLLVAAATRLVAATVCKCFWFDTTKDSAIYYKSAGQAADLRHLLTLDESYDSTTSILSLKMLTAGRIGISDTAGRITFTDAATDLIEVDNAIFEFNPDEDDFDFIVNGTSASLIVADAGLNTVGIGITGLTAKLSVEGSIYMAELAAAVGDTPGYGQLWVKNSAPCELWFTKDDGTDVQIS